MAGELFELELLGGATELRYRKMRPEVEQMPWGTLDLRAASEQELLAARKAWTAAAYQEHRTAVACAITLRTLLEARAPVDLCAVAARFPIDEMVHVELASRMAMEFGGGTEILYEPTKVVMEPNPDSRPLMQAAECAVRFFCVGEAISIPLLRATWHVSKHPLPNAVMARIVKDEAAHGVFGFTFLDWALPLLSEEDKATLGASADLGIRFLYHQWDHTHANRRAPSHDGDVLGWMRTDEYLDLAERSLEKSVIDPLRRRGIPLHSVRPRRYALSAGTGSMPTT